MTRISTLVAELEKSGREATEAEIRAIRDLVASAGFDPDALERVRGRGAGIVWRGRTLRGRDMLPPAEAHYVRHVLSRPEWPVGTTLEAYIESITEIVQSDSSDVFLSRYHGNAQVGFVGQSGAWRGPRGNDWILVEFRQRTGHITTAFQIPSADDLEAETFRSDVRWLTRPKLRS